MKVQILMIPLAVFWVSCKSIAQERNLLLIDREELATFRNHNESQEGASVMVKASTKGNSRVSITINTANKALTRPNYTVTNKTIVPPSGDKHDFYSQAPYYWPNPKTEDGLPYVHKDGKGNPEIAKHKDHAYLFQLSRDVHALGLAYYTTSDEKYAKKAAEFTRAWFLDEATKMNPNFSFGQYVPGRSQGRAMVFADTYYLVNLLDGIQLISGSKHWSDMDMEGLKGWFNELISWMTTSEIGKLGQAQGNNIGTLYDMQLIAYSLFVGNDDFAKKTIENSVLNRIDIQIDNEGKQTRELTRAGAWGYSVKNLDALFKIAQLAEKVDIDLWNYNTADGKSIKKAFLWLLPFAEGKKEWEYQQINPVKEERFRDVARVASRRFTDLSLDAVLSSNDE